MDELIKKITKLNDLIKFFKQKNSNPLVPTPKMPGIKELGSVKTRKSAKIPSIAPKSLKDPQKIAEQLKNPAPKKTKIEILKTDKNGQWQLLEKATWENAPHITPDKCTCGGGYKKDEHHYTCVDNNPPSPPNIKIQDHFSPKLKDAVKKFNDNVSPRDILWDHDNDHAYSWINHPDANPDSHGLNEDELNAFHDLTSDWQSDNEINENYKTCRPGGACGCIP